MFSTQSENESLMDRIEKDPQLRFALIGDKDLTITPCKPPPTFNQVKDWMKGRELLKKRKNEKNSINEKLKKEKSKENVDLEDEKLNCEIADLRTNTSRVSGRDTPIKDSPPCRTPIKDSPQGRSFMSPVCMFEVTSDDLEVTGTHVTPKRQLEKSLSVESDMSENSDIISPSPPDSSSIKLTQFRTSAFTSLKKKLLSVKFTNSQKTDEVDGCDGIKRNGSSFQSSTPVINPLSSQSPKVDINHSTPVHLSRISNHSTPAQPTRISTLFGSAFTPIAKRDNTIKGNNINTLRRKLSDSPTTPDNHRTAATGTGFVTPQSVNQDTGTCFVTPRNVPRDKASTSGTQASLNSESQLNVST